MNPTYQPHEQRVIDEAVELQTKLVKLSNFIGTQAFLALPAEDQRLLWAQTSPMRRYLEILNKRMGRFVPAVDPVLPPAPVSAPAGLTLILTLIPDEMEELRHERSATMAREEEPMLRFFEYDHLPAELRKVSQPFSDLAYMLVMSVPRTSERTAGLRKLLEAKDCAVRALLPL